MATKLPRLRDPIYLLGIAIVLFGFGVLAVFAFETRLSFLRKPSLESAYLHPYKRGHSRQETQRFSFQKVMPIQLTQAAMAWLQVIGGVLVIFNAQ